MWLGRGGCISCRIRAGTWGGFITQTGLMQPTLSASQTPSYSMLDEHWFSTLLVHMIPPFLRVKLLGYKKKDSQWLIGPLCYWIQVTEGDERRESAGREGGWGWRQRGDCMFVTQRELLACRTEEEQVVEQQYNRAQVLVLHTSKIKSLLQTKASICAFACKNQLVTAWQTYSALRDSRRLLKYLWNVSVNL